MGNLSTLLSQPEYVHVAINHFPLVGLLVAMAGLGVALVTRSRPAILIGLALVCLLCLSAWPVYHYGQEGYDRVLSMSDEKGEAYLKYHAELAQRWVFLYYVTAGVSALGCGLGWKWPRLLTASSIASLVLAAASLSVGMCIAHAGGEVRHREFRTGPPPVVAPERADVR